jgi:hypothetical protein
LPFDNPLFWGTALVFLVVTTLLAGMYPAFYLSSFRPAKVLKGSLNAGRFASWPRKVLVIVQFSVSTTLIIGTLVVYQQVQYARNRPIGYDRQGLISIDLSDQEYSGKQNVLRTELLASGVVHAVSFSSSPGNRRSGLRRVAMIGKEGTLTSMQSLLYVRSRRSSV